MIDRRIRLVSGRYLTLALAIGLAGVMHIAPAPAAEAPAAAPGISMPGPVVTLRHGGALPVPTRVGVGRKAVIQRESLVTPANITVTYTGFTVAAQTAFEAAVSIWEQILWSPQQIRVSAQFVALDDGVLGKAGAKSVWRDFAGAPLQGTWYADAMADALGGFDRDPGASDITASFNSAYPSWYFGTDGNPPAGKADFVSVVLHELGHGLGFFGSMAVSANTGSGSWGLGAVGGPVYPVAYDRFTQTGTGTQLLDQVSFPNPSVALGNALQSNNLYFDWRNASRQAGGYPGARLDAPAPWAPGSSYSHLDENTYPAGNANSLMTPSLSTGEAVHDPGPITRGIFRDMGWTVNDLAAFRRPPPPDLTNNGTTDLAIFRPSNGIWYVQSPATAVPWGVSTDIPVPSDYDGNGATDIAVFRPTPGSWFVRGVASTGWGTSGDIPVPSDYDGNGATDIAVYRPSSGIWYVKTTPAVSTPWGTTGDIPVPADYDGDGDADLAVFRPSTGVWYVNTPVPTSTPFGTTGDIPVPGDYDGDGDTDIAVWRPGSGIWFVLGGASIGWGVAGDRPLALPEAIARVFF